MAEHKIRDKAFTISLVAGTVTPNLPEYEVGDRLLLMGHAMGSRSEYWNVDSNIDGWTLHYDGSATGAIWSGNFVVMDFIADDLNVVAPTISNSILSDAAKKIVVVAIKNSYTLGTGIEVLLDESQDHIDPVNRMFYKYSQVTTSWDEELLFFTKSSTDESVSGDTVASGHLSLLDRIDRYDAGRRINYLFGWSGQKTAGLTPLGAGTFQRTYRNQADGNGIGLIVGVRPAAGAVLGPHKPLDLPTFEPIHHLTRNFYNNNTNLHFGTDYPVSDDTAFFPVNDLTSIDGELLESDLTIVENEINLGGHPGNIHPAIQMRFNVNPRGGIHMFGEGTWNIDMSGADRVFCITVGVSERSGILSMTDTGQLLGFRSDDTGDNAYKFIKIGKKDAAPNPATRHTVMFQMDLPVLELPMVHADAGNPTFDSASINGIAMGVSAFASPTRPRTTFTELNEVFTISVDGGASTNDGEGITMKDMKNAVEFHSVIGLLDQDGAATGQWVAKLPLVAKGPFNDSNYSVEFPRVRDTEETTIQASHREEWLGKIFENDSKITNAVYSSPSLCRFVTTGANSHEWNNVTVIKHRCNLSGTATYSGSGLALAGCPEVTHNNANLSGLVKNFTECTEDQYATITGTQAQLQAIIDGWANTTITESPVYAYKIVHTELGDISLNFPADYDVDMLRYEGDGSSELEAVMPEGSFLRNTSTSNGDTVRIVAVVPTLAISSSEPLTLLRYGFQNTQNIEGSTIGQLLNYDFSVLTPIFVEALLPGFVPQNIPSQVPFDGPLNFTMVRDPVYNALHGLLEGTHYDWDRTGNQSLTLTGDQNIFDVRSSKSDEITFNPAFINTPLKLEAKAGLSRVDAIRGLVITNMEAWKGAGSEHFDVTDPVNPVSKWFAVVSTVNINGASAYIRQVNTGAATPVTLTNDIVDEVFQYYRDDNHDGDTLDTDEYDRSDYALIKAFQLGKKPARVDVLANAGLTSLRSELYTVPLALEDHTYSGLNPGISAQLQLVIANKTVGGAFFSYEWIDGGSNTGADIVNQIHYLQVTTPNALVPGNTGLRWIDLPNMVQFNGNAVETERGLREGAVVATVGFYVSQGGDDHPSFSLFQGDTVDYRPDVVATAQGTNMPADGSHTELIVWNKTALDAPSWQASTSYSQGDLIVPTAGLGVVNVAGQFLRCTTAGVSGLAEPTWSTTDGGTTNDGTAVFTTYDVLFQSGDPGGVSYLDTYIDGQEFASANSEEFGWAFATIKNGESYRYAENSGFVSSEGFQFSVANFTSDPSYAADGVDGSTLTSRFTTDILNDEIDLISDTDFNSWELFAFYCYTQTLTAGLWNFRGAVIAEDGGYRIVVAKANIFLDEILGVFIKQLDDRRIYRDTAPTNPAKDPTTGSLTNEGGGGIAVNYYQRAFAVEVGSVAQATLDEVNAGVQALPTLPEIFARAMTDGTFAQYLEDLYVRGDLHRTKRNTYNPEGTRIENPDFTIETDPNGQVSRS